MEKEEEKERLKKVVYRLKVINEKIDNLQNSILSTKSTLNQSILINNQAPQSKTMSDINGELGEIRNSINSVIIPSLNNKIYN